MTCAKERAGRATVGSYAGVLTRTTMRIERVSVRRPWATVLRKPL